MRITALHRLPFDHAAFQRDVASAPECRAQIRENWDNAWIVVIANDAEPDFGSISWPDLEPNAQAPWLEKILISNGRHARAAFFLHFIDPSRPLRAGHERLEFPTETPAPKDLIELLDYSAPD